MYADVCVVIANQFTSQYRMVKQTPPDMDKVARMLRVEMIKTIDTLSQKYSQRVLDNKVIVDLEDGEICGMDTSSLYGSSKKMCLGSQCHSDK